MITDFEKIIYNKHLCISRGSLNKPFNVRKDFSGFNESEENYIPIKKLSKFFTSHPQINIDAYFKAPYEIYRDNEYYNLKFFTTQKAISLYSMYMKKVQDQSPDNVEKLQSIKKSLVFIIKFCADKNIPFSDYLKYKTDIVEDFISHYRQGNIDAYVLIKLPNFEKIFYGLDEELRSVAFRDIENNISKYKIKLHQSSIAKQLIHDTINKAVNILP